MYTGSEDGTIKIWDLRARSFQRNYDVGCAVNTVVLHPNQAELISGDVNGKVHVRAESSVPFHECSSDFLRDTVVHHVGGSCRSETGAVRHRCPCPFWVPCAYLNLFVAYALVALLRITENNPCFAHEHVFLW